MDNPPSSSADHLLLVALDLFGRRGYEGTSTREIARVAHKPMSAITYHFGGKQELYVAVARHLAGHISKNLGPALAGAASTDGRAEARAQIHQIFSTLTTLMLKPESASWARYILREQMDPTPAFDELYKTLMGPTLARLTDLIRRIAINRIRIDEARLRVLALFGQVLVFRVCRATVLRSNDWDDVGDSEAGRIRSIVLRHLDAVLYSLEGKEST